MPLVYGIIIIILLVWVFILRAQARQKDATIQCFHRKWQAWEKAYWKVAPAAIKLGKKIKDKRDREVRMRRARSKAIQDRYARNYPH